MLRAELEDETDFEGWRVAARIAIRRNVPPDMIEWKLKGGPPDLIEPEYLLGRGGESASFSVPRAFLDLAGTAILHKDPDRFALLYTLLWRLQFDRAVLSNPLDPLMARLSGFAKSVHRDQHKMTAFVRFRSVVDEGGERMVAWFEPEHHIVVATAPFFVRRFTNMRWAILSPEVSVSWDGEALTAGPGATREQAPAEDAFEDAWRTYYASIFNPARLKVDAMRAEMPKKYWSNLPEAPLIKPLIAAAQARSSAMVAAPAPTPKVNPQRRPRQEEAPLPEADTLPALRDEAIRCKRCPLWKPATQTVFGEGAAHARVVLLGEQPGDSEDLQGRPFVGPAGKLLDRALEEAGITRKWVYVTNAVKHFKFEPRGKKRLHKRPDRTEVQACRVWLDRELRLVRPDLVVALGATAAQALFGKATAVGANRGHMMNTQFGFQVMITVHPSYLLRIPPERQGEEFRRFVADLKLAVPYLDRTAG